MLTGFEKIIEKRILQAQKKGFFDNLPGSGRPVDLESERHISKDLRLAYKILKNAGCLPPEIELKKKIVLTEEILAGMEDAAEKYRLLKKLNYLIMTFNATHNRCVRFEVPQQYTHNLVERFGSEKTKDNSNV
jgi:hypothetical protein